MNEGNSKYFDKATTELLENAKAKPKKARYIGSMVADVHRTLLYGGLFMYPGDSKNRNGKLRLLYESNPMSFLVEQAGGKASTGHQRILDIIPTSLHMRTPIFLGSYEDVVEVEALYKKHYPNPELYPSSQGNASLSSSL